MITSLASNCDLKSIAVVVVGQGIVRVSRSVLAISIAIIGSLLGDPLVGVVLANATSLVLLRSAPSIGAFGWFSSLCACFYASNTFREKLVEASARPILHLWVIKFWAIHSRLMEAYTLWWNGGSVKKFWETNS
jgi:hypothetical protein